VDKVRAATEIVRKKRPDLKIEGPIQYGAAVDMEVGQVKCQIQKGRTGAVWLIFRIKYWNNTYKAVQEKQEHWPLGYVARVEQTRKRFKPRMYGR
jgi:phosphate acetyltransferase